MYRYFMKMHCGRCNRNASTTVDLPGDKTYRPGCNKCGTWISVFLNGHNEYFGLSVGCMTFTIHRTA